MLRQLLVGSGGKEYRLEVVQVDRGLLLNEEAVGLEEECRKRRVYVGGV